MSYAGTYGDDETCRHHMYWRSCKDCSLVGPKATQEQVDKVREQRRVESEKQEEILRQKREERHTFIVVRDGFGTIISEKKQ